jgi:hypothetical protein
MGAADALRYGGRMEATATITTRLKDRVEDVVARLRNALDLPSRRELLELTSRLEELDRRIATLAAERVAAMTESAPQLPEATEQEPAKHKKKRG